MNQSSKAEMLKDKGNAFMKKGNPKDAIAAYREAIKTDPAYTPAYANLGMVLAMNGNLEEAEQVYLDGMKANPGDYRLLSNAGVFYVRTEQYANAIKLLKDIPARVPDNEKADVGSMASIYLSVAYLQQEEFEQALQALKNALEMNHEAEPNALGLLEETIEEHAERNDDEPCLLCMAGMIDMINDDDEKAVKTFKKAIEADENAADAWFWLGLALGNPRSGDSPFDDKTGKRINKAIEALGTAIRLKPDWVDAHYRVGVLSLQLPDLESPFRAHQAFKRVIELAKEQNLDNKLVREAKNLLQNNEVLKKVAGS